MMAFQAMDKALSWLTGVVFRRRHTTTMAFNGYRRAAKVSLPVVRDILSAIWIIRHNQLEAAGVNIFFPRLVDLMIVRH